MFWHNVFLQEYTFLFLCAILYEPLTSILFVSPVFARNCLSVETEMVSGRRLIVMYTKCLLNFFEFPE